jgi:hypothetical protein
MFAKELRSRRPACWRNPVGRRAWNSRKSSFVNFTNNFRTNDPTTNFDRYLLESLEMSKIPDDEAVRLARR